MSKKDKRAQKDKKRRDAKKRAKADSTRVAPEVEAQRRRRGRECFERAQRARSQGRTEEAIEQFKKVLHYEPEQTAALVNLAAVLQRLERVEDAITCLRRAVRIDPLLGEAHNNLGTCLQSRGETEEAGQHFRAAVDARPDLGPAWVNLGTVKRYTETDDPDIAVMEKQLAQLPFNDPRVTPFQFALAKAFEDCGEFERSFEHLQKANRLHRSRVRYDVEAADELMRRIARVHDAEFLAAGPHESSTDAEPIFVVGFPRSGSTLVEQILASHSRVGAVGEVPDFDNVARTYCEAADLGDFPEKNRELPPAQLAELGARYAALVAARAPDAERVVDKSLNNFLHIGLIHRVLPGAKIVHCRRDPVDTGVACYRQYFSSPIDYAYDLSEIGARYRSYGELMRHWHAALPGRVLDVHYEELVANQETETRRLLDFCGLEWEDACMRFHETQRIVGSASVSQVRQPIYSTSVARWKRYEKHLDPLFEALGSCAPSRT
ncbi:MAG: tetratricopeptide repeat protein [bacterium]|nr:tetratricopeptide repeat protein [bacterium]